jgi:hypothetical protein
MNYRGAIALVLAASAACAGPEIPDPPQEEAPVPNVNGAEKQNIDYRVLEPCDVEAWKKETVNSGAMVGILRHKQWTKSAESYEAGGSDYFVLYLDDLGSERFFPRVLDESVRKAMLAADGKRVHLWGRWAPKVRYSEQDQLEISERWGRSQHPIDLDGNIPDPPTTWGGGFIVDCVDLFVPPLSRAPDLRYHSEKSIVTWVASATLAAEVSGMLRCEDLGKDPRYPTHKLRRYSLETSDGARIVLRPGLEGNPGLFHDLVGTNVRVTGRWAPLLVRPTDDAEISFEGPVLRSHPTDHSRVIAGGGVFVEQITPAQETPASNPAPTQLR